MLHYMLTCLILVTGVLSNVIDEDVPDSACLKLSDFKTIVSFEDIKETQWIAIGASETDDCVQINIENFTIADVETVREACKGKEGTANLPDYDYTKTVKKLTFSDYFNDSLLSYQDNAIHIVGKKENCNKGTKSEFRKFGGSYIWLAWDPKYRLYYTVAIQVPEDETYTCLIEDFPEEILDQFGEKDLPPARFDFVSKEIQTLHSNFIPTSA